MNQLPEYMTTHPFFRKNKQEMTEKGLYYKNQLDNDSTLHKKEKIEVFKELMDLGFRWPDVLRQEGFWCMKDEQFNIFKELPYPKENEMNAEDINEFVKRLRIVENKTPNFSYMGYSQCRVCGIRNGTKTYYTDLFAWPEGYAHYIEEHGVKPSSAFVLHIRGLIK